MAVALFKSPFGSREYHGTNRTEGKLTGRRRVFVQIETGCILGMELDKSDNANTVKRRLQLALNSPTEESSLTFGDIVLKQLVKEIVKAMNNGVDPLPVHSGLGGAYCFRNIRSESVAIMKPTDEEPFAPDNPRALLAKLLGNQA
ncbi:phosphatidylinositol 4-kinase gamma 7-like [Olea europaea subsp. europaea]|uniref:1-phosphatidylinositol 4-kinase n=1 Tax=Olea europaea subsp. europaea TaxID=158383 RepID=A0A8S0VPT1_OLEEU|nr:phosphatidylinositol 4-kinase gamma 7-like [Olea europaea subsp. europaea]CAA3033308.1 phosphatidylinositol 4-kinase gamma 7-like [Olea europaea subsp. europaea]